MAAPTSVRVEATSITTTLLRWTYGGSNALAVFRSTDGSSYSNVATPTIGATSYEDSGLGVGTKYWYKLSDDDGSTFSSVVTVFTHSCAGPISTADDSVVLPRFDSKETQGLFGDTSQVPGFIDMNSQETIDRMNDMARRIEAAFNGQDVAPDACIACPEDGAVVIDCSSGCKNWQVVADTDINSVSINWCGDFDGSIDFIIPPNTTVGVCGFPAGFGFGGDECSQAPISGGSTGRTVRVPFTGGGMGGGTAGGGPSSRPSTNKGVGNGSGTGSGGGGSGCTCVPNNGALTIKSCNANNSLKCNGAKALNLIACGGKGPYTWAKTGSITLQAGANGTPGTTAAGERITVKPPTNSGSAVAGNAYSLYFLFCQHSGGGAGVCSGSIFNLYTWRKFGCDDAPTTSCTGNSVDGSGCSVSPTSPCKAGDCNTKCNSGNCSGAVAAFRGADEPCLHDATLSGGGMCDTRTAGMISNGCNPCGLQAGSTVTVTDSLGAQATIIVRA